MCLNPKWIKGLDFPVPCGKCVECRIMNSDVWAYRCMFESRYHKRSCFLTLTYNEENLPLNGNLCKKDFQDFMKRLRFYLDKQGVKIRYFGCGEYGAKRQRPHYHIIIFGWQPDDLQFWKLSDGIPLYLSEFLARVWKKGFISVGRLSLKTVRYCSKYLVGAPDNYAPLVSPFTLCSRRPGIGLQSIPKSVFESNKLWYDGRFIRTPKCYRDKMNFMEKEVFERVRDVGIDKDMFEWQERLNQRREKFLKIFGETLDNQYRPIVYFNKK